MRKSLGALVLQAMKFAEALHDELGDPAAFPPGKISDMVKSMISKETAQNIKVGVRVCVCACVCACVCV